MCVCSSVLRAVTNAIVPSRWTLALFPKIWPLWIRNITAVLCVFLHIRGHVHSLAVCVFVLWGMWLRLAGTHPSFSLCLLFASLAALHTTHYVVLDGSWEKLFIFTIARYSCSMKREIISRFNLLRVPFGLVKRKSCEILNVIDWYMINT